MLSFELSAIDIILAISVVVLLILYMTKMPSRNHQEKPFRQPPIVSAMHSRSGESQTEHDLTECPRGFGNIRTLGEDNSVSERCLGCYRIMECYSENE